ncbi:MAG: hypothetical protein ACKVOW_07675 [Chitinophagaceae bacterium]
MNWYNVLTHFEGKGYVHNGLTLPFLIGSSTVIEPQTSLLSINDFITQAFNSFSPIKVMKCGHIGEYVFGTVDAETDAMRKQYRNIYTEFGNILITDNSFADCKILSEIILILEDEYQKRIDTKCFSKVLGEWEYYCDKEIIRLKELIIDS